MKQFIGYIFLTLIVVSCGTRSGYFRLEGRFQNFNQGEFYVYSPSGDIDGLDTIKVADGRFSYETPLKGKGLLVVVFPNYSEQAVIGESGAKVEMKGSASNLKEVEVTGTEDNELFTKFRIAANRLTPPEMVKEIERFVSNNPQSPVCLYLIRKHLLQSATPNYAKAEQLMAIVQKASPDDARLQKLAASMNGLGKSDVGKQLPSFSGTDVDGKSVGRIQLKSKVNVVSVWSSWNYDSQNVQRRLRKMKNAYSGDLAVISICIDGTKTQCVRTLRNDSVPWQTICDGKMWETPALKQLGVYAVPANIVADKSGKIVARDLDAQKMEDKIKSMLK